jgi:preprotein translocase subunit SecA
VDKVNSLEATFEGMDEEGLKSKTGEFKSRLSAGETLDDILPEAFATVREVGKRLMGMRHYDVQLVGGVILHRGRIAEMRTGEGKTLVATLAVYLNALEGRGVHVVTVNDYLARRDAVWMGQIYDFLGLSIGIVQNQRVSYLYDPAATGDTVETLEGGEIDSERDETGSFRVETEYLRPCSRQDAYRADITYGTNNEFGFDYLRDNMVQTREDMVMRPGSEMHYCIIDEVDSILIDEARTPLIISAPTVEAADQYYQYAKMVQGLVENTDYNVDEKMRAVSLTDEGIAKFEGLLGVENIYAEGGIRMVHHIEQALKGEVIFKRDKDYVVDNDEIVIIDEFTGRKMPGRRYSEGLHQALEAKEGVSIQRESQTLATITFQNLFRMYTKLSGMTGTAVTEEEEFYSIYGLPVTAIPTNRPNARIDHPDRIYRTELAKFKAIEKQILECRAKGQPILVGTISVEKNEQLSAYLSATGIEHEILNAKNHEREGEIIAQAGRLGAVTLATNMAGRGVDIKLGGTPVDRDEEAKVLSAGGLFVLGTERHESRRIDNQLRGRSARQGDAGETQFYVSTDDDLMRIFAGDRLKSVMTRLNVPDDMPIEQSMITKMLENAQKKVESHHFDSRKHLLQYDDVLNRQRNLIYGKRREVLDVAYQEERRIEQEVTGVGEVVSSTRSMRDIIVEMVNSELDVVVSFHTNSDDRSGWNIREIYETARTIFPLSKTDEETLREFAGMEDSKLGDATARDNIIKFLEKKAEDEMRLIEEKVITTNEGDRGRMLHYIEKGLVLRAMDTLWVEHLISVDYLRTGIGLRGYGQRDPLVEYKKETFRLFKNLESDIQKEIVYSFFKVGAGLQIAPTIMAGDKLTLKGAHKSEDNGVTIDKKTRDASGKKIGRNDPCTCGSGKKYKKCHGN